MEIVCLNVVKELRMIEHFFECPYCGEQISMLIDPSVRSQQYVEDCEVCCNPIDVHCAVEHDAVAFFQAESIEQ